MFLLDTVVLSELRKRDRSQRVVEWVSRQRSADLYLSVISVGEIERGIRLQQSKNPNFSAALSDWLDRVIALYADRILDVNLGASRRWGKLSGELGHDSADLLIAATALENGLAVVSRNVKHFRPSGVEIINPWED